MVPGMVYVDLLELLMSRRGGSFAAFTNRNGALLAVLTLACGCWCKLLLCIQQHKSAARRALSAQAPLSLKL
jgi:hypothetical protein